MEHQRECNICGGKNFEQAQDGSLKCLGCGARFASEKELQQELQQSTEEKRKAEAKQREIEEQKELVARKAREAAEAEQNCRERAIQLEREAFVLMTLHGRDGADEKNVVIKRTEEKRVFATDGSNKVYLDNAYRLFSADDILSASYNFQAGKAIYTQVGHVGGITTTPSGYQASTKKTGNARVMFASPQNKIKMEVLSVDLAHDVAKALGRTSDKIEIYHNYKSSEQHTNAVKAALASHNEFMVANALMQDAGEGYPSKIWAQSIADTLNKICRKGLELPPDIYKKLEPYFESDSFEEIEKVLPQLEAISNYKDAAQRLKIMRGKYNEMVYQKAMKYSEGDLADIEKATQLFESISSYKDAYQQSQAMRDKYNENAYEQAMKYSEGNLTDMRKAAKLFESLGNYKDAALRYKGTTANIEKAEKRKSKNAIKLTIVISAACLAVVVWVLTVIMPKSNYEKAISLLENGEIVDAYESLIALKGYKDSAEKASEIFVQYESEKLKTANVGDTVYFGAYEQDDDTSNGAEIIEWTVLEKSSKKVLVISKYALDGRTFNGSDTAPYWPECELRTWLNETFLNDAFSADELAQISITKVSDESGHTTNDRIFLLSADEAGEYFSSDGSRMCDPTTYAEAHGAKNTIEPKCNWWLRTQGKNPGSVVCVDCHGYIKRNGYVVREDRSYAVRPAMWINSRE